MTLDLKHKPAYCHALHWYFCPCLFDGEFSKRYFSVLGSN
jgi:hypothetical protein